jgi:hypothetical protein
VEYKSQIHTGNSSGNWHHLNIINKYENLSKIPEKHKIKELQKRAMLGIANISFAESVIVKGDRLPPPWLN